MKLAICGHGECGKDTAAEFLRANTVLRYTAGTSLWAATLVYERMTALGYHYMDAKTCWEDRRNHRELWAKIIGEYNQHDPVRLYRDCLAEQDILTGIRWRHEQHAIRAAGLVDLWLWIDRPGWPTDSTMEFGPEECDVTMLNDGPTTERLLNRLAAWSRFSGLGLRTASLAA